MTKFGRRICRPSIPNWLVCNFLHFPTMRVLIAEDNKTVAGTLADMIGHSDNQVVEMVHSGLEAIHAYDRHIPDLVVMDYLMDGLNGLTACRNILAKHPAARIVLVSGALDPQELSLIRSGAWAILRKPVTIEQLRALFESLSPTPMNMVVESEPTEDVVDPCRFF